MEENTQHFWHIMLYYFKKGENSTEMQKKNCVVYGEGAVTDQMCQKWFAKFCARDFLLDTVPQSNRPVEVDSDQIETLRTINLYTMREIANKLTMSQNNKVIGENEKYIFYGKKTIWTFWTNPIKVGG